MKPQVSDSGLIVRGRQLTIVTALEVYFSRSLGLALLTIALLHLLLTGAMPWTTSPQYSPEQPDPYAKPTVLISSTYHASLMFYCYMRYTQSGISGFVLGIIGSAAMAAMGLWCILFADDKGHISRRTGKDKRVSGFPFKNVDADAARGKKGL